MDINDLRTISTVLTFVAFVVLVAWAFSGSRKQVLEEVGRLPLEDDDSADSENAGIKHN